MKSHASAPVEARKRIAPAAPADNSISRCGPESGGGHVKTLELAHTRARHEIRRRAPWIFLALGAGVVMILVGSHFEDAFARRLDLVLFLPVIVYMSDSIGTETLTLFVRELALRKIELHRLFLRELTVGIALGLLSGVPMGLVGYAWLGDAGIAMTLILAMTVNGVIAVLTGMLTPLAFATLGKDPAIGTDEITTALSDNLSMLTYLFVATLMLF
jgi:magnesium transporter